MQYLIHNFIPVPEVIYSFLETRMGGREGEGGGRVKYN
jgi:hypothetical protein